MSNIAKLVPGADTYDMLGGKNPPNAGTQQNSTERVLTNPNPALYGYRPEGIWGDGSRVTGNAEELYGPVTKLTGLLTKLEGIIDPRLEGPVDSISGIISDKWGKIQPGLKGCVSLIEGDMTRLVRGNSNLLFDKVIRIPDTGYWELVDGELKEVPVGCDAYNFKGTADPNPGFDVPSNEGGTVHFANFEPGESR
ncbi:MAG: hypothetical protein AAB597_00230 [Patescibacteria group bacterium]